MDSYREFPSYGREKLRGIKFLPVGKENMEETKMDGKKMRKAIMLVLAVMLLLAVSCTAADKKIWSQRYSYKDPQMVGGYWDVTMQTGQTFSHVRCLYWGTEDDTAVFEPDDGRIICQSGACVCVYVGDR